MVQVPTRPTRPNAPVNCLPGYTLAAEAASKNKVECVACAAGKYKSSTDNVQCTACPDPEHMRSSQGSTSLLDCLCVSGFYGPDANGTCTGCAGDHYKEPLGVFPCSKCPVHMGSPNMSTSRLACACNAGFIGPMGGPCIGVCTHEAVRAAFLRLHSDREWTGYDIKLSCDWELAAFYRDYATKHKCRYLADSMYMCAAKK